MSRFDAVRARWESTHHHHHRGDDSPTIPLLNNNTIDKSHSTPVMTKMDQGKFHYTIPGPGKRIASGIGGMWNKPLNTIRNKAFSRDSRHASSEMSSGGGHSRKSESGTSFGHGSIKAGKNEKMIRSKTTSFLPVPTKVSRPWLHCQFRSDHKAVISASSTSARSYKATTEACNGRIRHSDFVHSAARQLQSSVIFTTLHDASKSWYFDLRSPSCRVQSSQLDTMASTRRHTPALTITAPRVADVENTHI